MYCPNCEEEVELNKSGICPGCSEEFRKKPKKVELDEFEEEDEFSADPWGNEFED